MTKAKRGPASTARPGAGRRRCVVVNQEIVALRTRDLRLFKGCVVLWTNCRHPYYDDNPFPEKAPKGRQVWVGDMWPFFYAGHKIELDNLKHILEYRHTNGLAMMIGGPS